MVVRVVALAGGALALVLCALALIHGHLIALLIAPAIVVVAVVLAALSVSSASARHEDPPKFR